LIELIVVMAMLLVVVGISFPSLKGFFRGRTLDSEARRFLSLTRYAQSRAVSEGLPMLLWIDAQEGTYGLQVQTGFVDLDRKAVEYKIDKDLTVEVSAPPVGLPLSQQKRTALQLGNLPAIRINAEGFIEDISPETVAFHETEYGNERSLWITQTGNRLNYEVTSSAPVNFRR
jgi:type II secretory pathway pseudopilin PulG